MKKLTTGKMWLFAIGQLGWSMLSALITNWLVYIYQPDSANVAAGQTLFIPQGRVIFGAVTIIGGITALVSPLTVPSSMAIDFAFMILLTGLVWLFAWRPKGIITRWQAAILLAVYLVYIAQLAYQYVIPS